jgi:hypothetical protein
MLFISFSIINKHTGLKLRMQNAHGLVQVFARNILVKIHGLGDGTGDAALGIITFAGKHMEAFRLHGTRGVKVIDLRHWNTGTYIIKLLLNGKTIQSEKFVKI